ncbi:MAG: peptide-methionine (S)-S-oxide reductase MsrA [Pseudomonadota bacterium]
MFGRSALKLGLWAGCLGVAFIVGSAGLAGPAQAENKTAIFAGGCFWCIEKDFEHVAGVVDVVSGYTGGTNDNPTYRNHGRYGHREVVTVTYDSTKTTYARLLEIFWRSVDPVDGGGQFCDRGHSYSPAIYAVDAEQLAEAQAQKAALDASGKLGKPIATEIALAQKVTPAEDYHQDYYKKNPVRYKYYRYRCGRDQRVKALWGADAYTGVTHIKRAS